VQYTRNFERTVCATENTTELRSAVSNTFHNDMEKRNPYQSKSRRRRPEPTGVGGVQYAVFVKKSEGNMLGIARASTKYGMWRIKLKTETIATDNTYCVVT
jgi:hypothetical protein